MSDNEELKEVFTTGDPNQAEIIRLALEADGIPCQIEGENQAGLAGVSGMAIRLFVRAQDHDDAHEFIEAHLRGGGLAEDEPVGDDTAGEMD